MFLLSTLLIVYKQRNCVWSLSESLNIHTQPISGLVFWWCFKHTLTIYIYLFYHYCINFLFFIN